MCSVCQKTFVHKDKLKRHLENVHTMKGEKPFKCDLCDKAFQRCDQLPEHKIAGHPETVLLKYLPKTSPVMTPMMREDVRFEPNVITMKEEDMTYEQNVP